MKPLLETRRSAIHGNGVFAARDIAAGTELIVYEGRRITHAEADDVYGDSVETGHTFLFTLDAQYLIDGNVNGNAARYINHSCDPNCQAFLHEAPDGDPKHQFVMIEAARDLRYGEELTYDYKITLQQRHTAKLQKIWACHCGAACCTGTMLKEKRRRNRS
ncbi:MAG: SET domain-containing protein-lysine N-methyltransferase [Lysobacterales bacterium CG02_land_8_20_14_3_00_62_12]|nr:MAG: SET domain-containing protein-lysine N-methyltransferase [Xanthomonadales bacterium CG02_land_8_20_14_3_00_62_12]